MESLTAARGLVAAVDRGVDRIGRVAAWLTLAIALLMAVNVLLRYAFSIGSVWSQELEWHLLAPLVLLGMTYALGKGEHVRVDVFYARYSPRGQAAVDLLAALLAVPLKKNLPVALITTFYTNPVTIVPLYVLAYGYGALLLGERHAESVQPFEMDWSNLLDSLSASIDWMLSLGKPLAVGLVALALTLAAIGYVAARVGWRVYVVLAWRARCKRRAARR